MNKLEITRRGTKDSPPVNSLVVLCVQHYFAVQVIPEDYGTMILQVTPYAASQEIEYK